MWEPASLAIIIATFLLAGFVKGVVGLGLPTVSLAILTATLGLVPAMALLLLPSFVTNVWQALSGGALKPLMRRLWIFLLAVCLGTWLGAIVLARSDASLLSVLLGVLLIAYAAYGLARPQISVPPAWESWSSPMLGLVNGVFTGMTGSFVVPGVPYFQALGLKRDELIQAMGILFTVSTLALALAMGDQRLLTLELGTLSALAVLPALLGMAGGQIIRTRLSEAMFRKVLFAALFVLGSYIVIQSGL